MAEKPVSSANEGEGSRTAAHNYNKGTADFIASGKVPKAARDAEKALDGPEAAELKKAEEAAKSHSHGEDPALRRKTPV